MPEVLRLAAVSETPDPDIVKTLEALLERAKAGDVKQFFMVTVNAKQEHGFAFMGEAASVLYAMECAKLEILMDR